MLLKKSKEVRGVDTSNLAAKSLLTVPKVEVDKLDIS